MLKPISEVMGARLVDLDQGQTLGEIVNWVINPDEKKISALMVRPGGVFAKTLAISPVDIIEYGPRIVVVRNQNSLVPPAEIVHLPKLIRHHQHLLGSVVATVSGKQLGNVEDILFETCDSTLQKIYVRPGVLGLLHQPDLIIGVDKIVTIKSTRIIVTDDSGYFRATTTAPAPSPN